MGIRQTAGYTQKLLRSSACGLPPLVNSDRGEDREEGGEEETEEATRDGERRPPMHGHGAWVMDALGAV